MLLLLSVPTITFLSKSPNLKISSLLFALIEIGDIDIINISSDTNKFFLLFLSFLADVCPNPFDLLALFCLFIRDARSLVLGLGRPILFHEFKKLVTSSSFEFPLLSRESRLEHINLLKILLEKQKVMYARLSLSDDPKALELKSQVEKSVTMMGFPTGTNMNVLFDGMRETIETLESAIDL